MWQQLRKGLLALDAALIHPSLQTHTQRHRHTDIRDTCVQTQIHVDTHTDMQMDVPPIYTCTGTHTDAYTHAQIPMLDIESYKHIHTWKHTHTHVQASVQDTGGGVL